MRRPDSGDGTGASVPMIGGGDFPGLKRPQPRNVIGRVNGSVGLRDCEPCGLERHPDVLTFGVGPFAREISYVDSHSREASLEPPRCRVHGAVSGQCMR